MDSNLLSFLLSFGASVSWDGVKGIKWLLSKKPDDSPEKQCMNAIRSTMKEYFEHYGYEFDEDSVMQNFLDGG